MLRDSPFLKALRREPVPHTPIWIMRQAGRYLPEYRKVRDKVTFLELCKTPELACQVTVEAAARLGVDAAILFADILLILEPMGMHLEFAKGEGPVLHDPLRDAQRVDTFRTVDPHESLGYVLEAVKLIRKALPANLPLIGFSGAPFTLASYMIEGGSSKHFVETKAFMYREPDAWHRLCAKLADNIARYLKAQIDAGANALQLFDSWVGHLSPSDYRQYVLPHTKAIFDALPKDVPTIHFGVGTSTLLELLSEAGGHVIGIDYHQELGQAWARIPHNGVQGNLDPVALFAGKDFIRDRVKRILDQAAGKPGHVFNLGHGILPGTPVDGALWAVEAVHELSRR
jgi:uroporphyrinogen decarboxylase